MQSKQSLRLVAVLTMVATILADSSASAFESEKFPGRGKREAFGKACEYNLKGISLADSGKTREAVELYKKAIEVYPYYSVTFSNLGNAYSDLHRFDEAVEQYRKAVKISPDFAAAYSNMADALMHQKKFLDAEIACKNALRVDPGYVLAMTNLSEVYIATNRPQEAKTVLLAASGLTTTSAVKKLIAEDLEKANKMLEKTK